MTRVTPLPREIAKLTRSLASTPIVPRSTQLLNSSSKTAAVRVRKELENGHAEVPSSERTITTTHRPTAMPTPNPNRTIPLMQAFHTTQTAAARIDVPATIDFAFLPSSETLYPRVSQDPFAYVRVPLLPDHFQPDPIFHPPEAADAPLQQPEIVVMAADSSAVNAVSALSEVEGMSPDGVELSFVRGLGSGQEEQEGYAGGMLTGLWQGLVDDVFSSGPKGKPAL